MTNRVNLQEINRHETVKGLAAACFCQANSYQNLSHFFRDVLPQISELCDCSLLAVVRPHQGTWDFLAKTADRSPPDNLLSETLDSEDITVHDAWGACPLSRRSTEGHILLCQFKNSVDPALLAALASLFGHCAQIIAGQQHHKSRIQRLEAILEIAGSWNQNLEMESLLLQMAEASTRLLRAERASIFLWDRKNKLLIGRPALGVEGGELRIADDRGTVGQVIHSGEVRRVDEHIDQEMIDRQVDKQLGFETRNLLCVPLRGKDEKVLGAFELINKSWGNFSRDDEEALIELASHAAIALENTQQHESLLNSRAQIAEEAANQVRMIGESAAIQTLRSTVQRVAKTDLALLILGENGTGKEIVSQMVHYHSNRRDEPFIAVNCAALTETLLESELFGHEKGAFTDARETRSGKFELASGGTLFLDEIGDLSLGGQAKLLRVLEEKVVVRVGGSVSLHTDARVIAATNQNLAEMVGQRTFREDLFFRLNVVTLELPPLRERTDDIMLLANHFLSDFCLKARREVPSFSASATKRLRQHPWPGNVRELRNLMERLAYLTQGNQIDADELAFILTPERDGMTMVSMDRNLTDATKEFQVGYIRKHIEASGGNMTDAARRLGLHRSNLYRKIRQLDMHVDESE